DAIQAAGIAGIRDIVPTYRSVAVYFDPLRTDSDLLIERIGHEAQRANPAAIVASPPLRIPVCSGGELGPDLDGVAAFAGLPQDAVVALHSGATYRVFMLGFVPGFAYLGLVDGRIAMPRHSTPRARVPVRSVGIAG